MSYFIIYKITNKINKKYYIGCHKTKDLNDGYFGSGDNIISAIKKHGRKNFNKEILFVLSSEKEMLAKEKEIVTEQLTSDPLCYNIRPGGIVGFYYINRNGLNNKNKQYLKASAKHRTLFSTNPEYREKWFAALRNTSSPEHMQGMVERAKTPGAIQKKKETLKKIKHQQGAKNSNYGKCWIMNLKDKICKTIQREKIEDYIQLGWIKGRKIIFE